MVRPKRGQTGDLRSIKVSAETHARLITLTNIFDKTISDMIDELIAKTYPEVIEETAKIQEHWAELRQKFETKERKSEGE